MERLLRNLRHAVRGLVRTPLLTTTVILTLALTIGASSAVFSLIDDVLLRPLPFPSADRLVYVQHVNETSSVRIDVPPSRMLDWSERNYSFDAIASFYTEDVTDTTEDRPKSVRKATVTPGFLEVWGIAPAAGRDFIDDDHRFGAAQSILISDRYWHEHFGRDPAAIGQRLRIDLQPYTVVGVMPTDLERVDPDVDVWAPLAVDAPWTVARTNGWFNGAVGRLKRGITLDRAVADLNAIQAGLAIEYPETDGELTIRGVPYKEIVVGAVSGSLWLLFAAVLVLLLIASTNVAALLLARAAQRERDIVVRYSLGASHMAVASYLLAETAVLAVAGAFFGFLVASVIVAAMKAVAVDLPRFDEVSIDAGIFVYTLFSAVAVALICGALPAVKGATGVGVLSRWNRTQVSSRHAANWMLVGVQVTLSVMLLTGAGLLLRSWDALSRVDPGFDIEHVLTFRLSGSFSETDDFAAVLQRINSTLDELTALPGIEAAATSFAIPGVLGAVQDEFELAEGTPDIEARIVAETRMVSASYFDTLRIPLLSGERCERTVDSDGYMEVLVNRSFADRYFPRSGVIGRVLAGDTQDRIVGIVGDARELGTNQDAVPTVYECYSAPTPFPWFFVRTTGDPSSVAQTVRARLNELEPLRSVYDMAPLEQRVSRVHMQDRLRTILLTLLSMAAVSLTGLGVYGTLSFMISARRREVGLRMALGAVRGRIVSEFLFHSLRIVGGACIMGVTLSLLFSRSLSGMLFGVTASDPPALLAAVGVVFIVATVAALIPALRASRIDPMRALRDE